MLYILTVFVRLSRLNGWFDEKTIQKGKRPNLRLFGLEFGRV